MAALCEVRSAMKLLHLVRPAGQFSVSAIILFEKISMIFLFSFSLGFMAPKDMFQSTNTEALTSTCICSVLSNKA